MKYFLIIFVFLFSVRIDAASNVGTQDQSLSHLQEIAAQSGGVLPQVPAETSTDLTENAQSPLDIFLEENFKKGRGPAFRTTNAVVRPLGLLELEEWWEHVTTSDAFVKKVDKNDRNYTAVLADIVAFGQMSPEEKKLIYFNRYSIFTINKSKELVYAGVVELNDPDSDGWSNLTIRIKEDCRGLGLGKEVVGSIGEEFFSNHKTDIYHKLKFGNITETLVDFQGKRTLLEHQTFEPTVLIPKFRGLQACVHESNTASHKLFQSDGWKFYITEENLDLKESFASFTLYRFEVLKTPESA